MTGPIVEFIGTAEKESELSTLARELGCGPLVRFPSTISKGDALAEIARYGVLFIHLMYRYVFPLTISLKAFDCVLTEQPILCAVIGQAVSIL